MKPQILLLAFVSSIGLVISLIIGIYVVAYFSTSSSQIARALIWTDADVDDYKRFPSKPVSNKTPPFHFAQLPDGVSYQHAFETVSYQQDGQEMTQDFEIFLTTTETTAFMVIKDDVMLYENYFHGYDRDSTQTSFSIAKSFVSALVGIAIDEGYIDSVDDPVTKYLPELRDNDTRFDQVTLQNLLTMSSGVRFVKSGLPWSDDTATYYSPDLRKLTLSSQMDVPPNQVFQYNPFNTLLLGMVLERATDQPVSSYLESKIWQPLGMEAPASWSLDSNRSGFEKIESGINGRAVDFAKFGRLYLHKGNWNGQQIIPEAWIEDSIRADDLTDPNITYQYFWWVHLMDDGDHHPFARGNYGQFIYLVPESNLMIIRFGKQFGYDDWPAVFADIAFKIDTLDNQTAVQN